jgi:AAA ATPase domain
MDSALVGREAEVEAVRELARAVASGPRGSLIEGEAGIGKTTLSSAGVEAAIRAGLRTLVSRGAGAEVNLKRLFKRRLRPGVQLEVRITEVRAPPRVAPAARPERDPAEGGLGRWHPSDRAAVNVAMGRSPMSGMRWTFVGPRLTS